MSDGLYQEVILRLVQAGIKSPRLEARLLIEDALKNKQNNVFSVDLDDEERIKLEQNIQKRLNHMPLDKILQKKEFYKSTFIVSEDVLSPRPDTEILVESSIEIAHSGSVQKILELGIGSGCVLFSILREINNIQGIGIDFSKKALSVAQHNLEDLNLKTRCRLLEADWFEDDFFNLFEEKFDMVVSNPPYIPTSEIKELETEVKKYDPLVALDGGIDGMNSYRRIAKLLPNLLKKGGYGLFEIGQGQARFVRDIFEAQGLKLERIVLDLAGIERVLIFQNL